MDKNLLYRPYMSSEGFVVEKLKYPRLGKNQERGQEQGWWCSEKKEYWKKY